MTRFAALQKNQTVHHPKLPQTPPSRRRPQTDHQETGHEEEEEEEEEASFTFVVAADTQFGMLHNNASWEEEMAYSEQAVAQINALQPLFCTICGDLVNMSAELWPEEQRQANNAIQDRQNADFQRIWSQLDPDIPLICVCGNHDVGDRPTPASIARFAKDYGDDHLAFWARRAYNIVLNTSLFSDPSAAPDLWQAQFTWLEERLQYARDQQASHIFVFGHHPWFLYDENETADTLPGYSSLAAFDGLPPDARIDDSYFIIPRAMRKRVLALLETYNVTAAFAGHFHQNLVTYTSFGMPMITTSALSEVFQSTGVPADFDEPKNERGMRLVTVQGPGKFQHEFLPLGSKTLGVNKTTTTTTPVSTSISSWMGYSFWALLSGALGAMASCFAKVAFASNEDLALWLPLPDLSPSNLTCPEFASLPAWLELSLWLQCHLVSKLVPRLLALVAMILCNISMVACFVGGLQESGSVAGTALATGSNFVCSVLVGYMVWNESLVSWPGFFMVVAGTILLMWSQRPSPKDLK